MNSLYSRVWLLHSYTQTHTHTYIHTHTHKNKQTQTRGYKKKREYILEEEEDMGLLYSLCHMSYLLLVWYGMVVCVCVCVCVHIICYSEVRWHVFTFILIVRAKGPTINNSIARSIKWKQTKNSNIHPHSLVIINTELDIHLVECLICVTKKRTKMDDTVETHFSSQSFSCQLFIFNLPSHPS